MLRVFDAKIFYLSDISIVVQVENRNHSRYFKERDCNAKNRLPSGGRATKPNRHQEASAIPRGQKDNGKSPRSQGHQLELEPVAKAKKRKIAWPPFPPAFLCSASDSHWPLPRSQWVREQKYVILCNKEQPRDRGQGVDLRTNKKANR